MPAKPMTRTRRTMRRMGPLTREAQEIQNDLIKLARRLERFQAVLQEAEGSVQLQKAEAARIRGHIPFQQVAEDRKRLMEAVDSNG